MRSRKHQSSRANSLGWLTRCVAAFMLALLLPAAVLAAPLRYCMGQSGHRAIEFVHAKVSSHANSTAKDGASLEGASRDPHVIGSYCQDRLLLPVVKKSKSSVAPRRSSDPVLSNNFRFDLRASVQRPSHLASRLAELRQPDPHLVTLKTVVLLN